MAPENPEDLLPMPPTEGPPLPKGLGLKWPGISKNPEEDVTIERYHGLITKVGDATVKSLSLPDWLLDYIKFPPGEMPKYRKALMREHANIRQVTESRIYFSQD